MMFVSYLEGQTDRWICSLDPVTLESRRLSAMPPCSHLMSNGDGSLLVGDGSGTPTDVANTRGHEIPNDPFLHLFDLRTGSTRPIARHNSSWRVHKGNRQVTHPHPSFTPDQRQVLFSSDAEGEPALYLADLE
jgi:oligogalacturonide lyase